MSFRSLASAPGQARARILPIAEKRYRVHPFTARGHGPSGSDQTFVELGLDKHIAHESGCGEKPACKYGASCYRKTPKHLEQFSHPERSGNEDGVPVESIAESSTTTTSATTISSSSIVTETINVSDNKLKRTILELGKEYNVTIINARNELKIRGEMTSVEKCVTHARRLVSAPKKSMRPTHFISLPLTELGEQVEALQARLLQGGDLEMADLNTSMLIAPPKLHMTVAVLTLSNEADMEEAVNLIRGTVKEVCARHSVRLRVNVGAVNTFGRADRARVIYSEVKAHEESLALYDELISELRTSLDKFTKKDDRFTPHLTLLKLSNQRGGGKRVNALDATKLIKAYKEHSFGTVDVGNVLLCKMGGDATTGGYVTRATVPLE